MKFIADVMLGKLAKQLRLLGFDVLYDRTFDDNEIIRLSLEQHRLILTRDTALVKRPLAVRHLFIDSENPQKQIQQVLTLYPPDSGSPPLTRCSECNTRLKDLSRDDAREMVPHHIYERGKSFLHCPECGRIYWEGSHVENMRIKKQ